MKLNAKADMFHYLIVTFVIVGIVVVFNRVGHQHTDPLGTQTGIDVAAVVVLGG